MKILTSSIAALALAVGVVHLNAGGQMATEPGPAFDVASVREAKNEGQGGTISGPTPGRFTIINIPLKFVMTYAYGTRDHELAGVPDWTTVATYDISATYPPGQQTPTDAEVRAMLRTLLADRFGVKLHREQREIPTYDLVLAGKDGTLGPQLTRSDVDCQQWFAEKRPQINAGGPSPVNPSGQRPACMLMATRWFLSGGTQTIAQLTGPLQSMVRRPVLDRTGLTGTFNMDMKWAPTEPITLPAGVKAEELPSIFTAVQEQLGLRLVPSRAPFDVVVIDAVQRPTPD